MSYSNYGFQAPAKHRNNRKTLWIVLGSLGGVFLVLMGICCGFGVWLFSFPGTSATAQLPFEYESTPIVQFEVSETIKSAKVPLPANITCRQYLAKGFGGGGGVGSNSMLWVYTPTTPTGKKQPCVLIGPAGTTLLEGSDIGEGSMVEHVPYLLEGFVVIYFSIDGNSEAETADPIAYNAFVSSNAGLANARNALEFARKLPEVNPQQIFVAGHSSAGSLALLFAEHEKRLAGCVAYAPCVDLKKRFPGILVRTNAPQLPNLADFIVRSAPRTHELDLACPTMVFHAEDDSNVPIADSRGFVDRTKAAGKDVVLEVVPTGDHYDSMIEQGIGKGIQWMKAHLR